MNQEIYELLIDDYLDQRKYLYHGTTENNADRIIANGIDLKAGKSSVDFGKGFYTTPDILFAQKCAEWKSSNFEIPTIIRLEIDLEILKQVENVRIFKEANAEWGQFIINNRSNEAYRKAVKSKDYNQGKRPNYDIVIGDVADWRIRAVVAEFKRHPQLMTEVIARDLLNDHFGKQVTFHTKSALSIISSISKVERRHQ